MKIKIAEDDEKSKRILDIIIQAAITKSEYFKTAIGFIVMESVSIDEGFHNIGDIVYRPGIDPMLKKRCISMAIFNIILLAELGFIHGDHHLYNLLISQATMYCGYFNPEPNNSMIEWSRTLSCCFIDFGRTYTFSMLEKKYPSQKKHVSQLLQFIQDFKTAQSNKLQILDECLKIIYRFGFFYKGRFNNLRPIETITEYTPKSTQYTWFFKDIDKDIDEEVANYVQQLFIARQRAQEFTKSILQRFITNVHELQSTGELQVSRDWSENFIQNILELQKQEKQRKNEEENRRKTELLAMLKADEEGMNIRNQEYRVNLNEKRKKVEEEEEEEEEEEKKERRIEDTNVLSEFTELIKNIEEHKGGSINLIGGGEKEEINEEYNLICKAFITYTNGLVSISNLKNELKQTKLEEKNMYHTTIYNENIPKYDFFQNPNNMIPVYGGKNKTKKNKIKKRKSRKRKSRKIGKTRKN